MNRKRSLGDSVQPDPRRQRLQLEVLEDRRLLAVFTVTHLDDGQFSRLDDLAYIVIMCRFVGNLPVRGTCGIGPCRDRVEEQDHREEDRRGTVNPAETRPQWIDQPVRSE